MQQDLAKTNSSVNNALSSVNILNTSVNNASVMLGNLNNTFLNLSGNYWVTNASVNTVSLSLVSTIAWLKNVSLIGEQNSLEYFLCSECSVRLFKQREFFVLVCKKYFRHCFSESEDNDELVEQCFHAIKQCF